MLTGVGATTDTGTHSSAKPVRNLPNLPTVARLTSHVGPESWGVIVPSYRAFASISAVHDMCHSSGCHVGCVWVPASRNRPKNSKTDDDLSGE